VIDRRVGPGLAKVRTAPLVVARQLVLARGTDARWRELFEHADTVSEGAVKNERGGPCWYGTSSFILPLRSDDTEEMRSFVSELASRDLHVRLRAVRAACREAQSRAPGRLGAAACEMTIVPDPRGVRIDVDVSAPLVDAYERSTGSPQP
jgi:hypothetical protein